MSRFIRFLITHGIAVAIGFGFGIYFLPILTAPPSPDAAVLEARAADAQYTAELTRELRGSDFLHWGEGTISVTGDQIIHMGKLAPGPDYKVYLTKGLVDHEDAFVREEAVQVGDVKSFDGFILELPADVNIDDYTSVLVWCESFSEFITAGTYR